MVYYSDPERRRMQEEEARRTGVENKMLTSDRTLSAPLPVVPYSKPSWKDRGKDALIGLAKGPGIKLGADFAGQGISAALNPAITVSGTLPDGNFQMSDGGITSPSGDVIEPGSTAKDAGSYGAAIMGAINLWNTLSNKNASGADKAVGGLAAGSQIASAIPGLGALGPVGTGLGAAYGGYKALSSDASGEEKAKAVRRLAEDTGMGVATAGISSVAQLADQKLLGGKLNKLRGKYDEFMDSPVGAAINPVGYAQNKILSKGLSMLGGGKDEDQQSRDRVRAALQGGGFFDPEGKSKDDWTAENADGSSFDIGKDGGARLDDGRRYDEVNTDKQGGAIGAMNPLAYLVTGGDEKLATSFAGYFTNTITQGAGGSDMAVANGNALDKYKKAGFDTPDKAHAGIDELVKAGKIPPDKAAAFHGGINTVFGTAPKAPGTSGRKPITNSMAATPGGQRKRRGDNRRVYAQQTYTPNVYAPQTTAPMGTPSPYGDSFAQSLANVYMANQEL